jgi:hypothetical protein
MATAQSADFLFKANTLHGIRRNYFPGLTVSNGEKSKNPEVRIQELE